MIFKMILNIADEGADPEEIEEVLRSLVSRRDVFEPLMLALESAVPAVIKSVTLESRFASYLDTRFACSPEAIRSILEGDTSLRDPLDADSPSYLELANSFSDEELFLAADVVIEAEQTKDATREIAYAVIDQAMHSRLMDGYG